MKSIIIFIALSVVGMGLYSFRIEKKIAYINTGEVFTSFHMSQETDEEIKTFEEKKKNIIDSIADKLNKIQAGVIKIEAQQLEFYKKEFLKKRNQFAEEIARMKQGEMEKIWKQINQYVSDYGKEKGYDVILGANGQGSLMYANEKIDISKEITIYINEKYSGKK